eukprot:CAMPEP_0204336618 /NCGR_PEP_ID=MMETSP0469-20131031/19676_1 /ASSEMBLY_ACC=CAM_ASM_000384 /TAXON_ID=2969 /ORGANISM="Oxyrrhis marina" /LENGTH=83 /DNA_ID=CAMNT_0051320517 /DNA_START=73 /DNA_END=322 /DNA_ORIENTATION=-
MVKIRHAGGGSTASGQGGSGVVSEEPHSPPPAQDERGLPKEAGQGAFLCVASRALWLLYLAWHTRARDSMVPCCCAAAGVNSV